MRKILESEKAGWISSIILIAIVGSIILFRFQINEASAEVKNLIGLLMIISLIVSLVCLIAISVKKNTLPITILLVTVLLNFIFNFLSGFIRLF